MFHLLFILILSRFFSGIFGIPGAYRIVGSEQVFWVGNGSALSMLWRMWLCMGNTQLHTCVKHALNGEPHDCGDSTEVVMPVWQSAPLQPTLSFSSPALWKQSWDMRIVLGKGRERATTYPCPYVHIFTTYCLCVDLTVGLWFPLLIYRVTERSTMNLRSDLYKYNGYYLLELLCLPFIGMKLYNPCYCLTCLSLPILCLLDYIFIDILYINV